MRIPDKPHMWPHPYVPRLHKLIKWFADDDVAHRN